MEGAVVVIDFRKKQPMWRRIARGMIGRSEDVSLIGIVEINDGRGWRAFAELFFRDVAELSDPLLGRSRPSVGLPADATEFTRVEIAATETDMGFGPSSTGWLTEEEVGTVDLDYAMWFGDGERHFEWNALVGMMEAVRFANGASRLIYAYWE